MKHVLDQPSSACSSANIAFLFVLSIYGALATTHEDLLQTIASRTSSEWRDAWHTECHRRCREQLIPHVNLACTYDIYRVGKRSAPRVDKNATAAATPEPDATKFPFLSRREASQLLTSQGGHRGLRKRGIMNECCYQKPCAWEEYAEYCHQHSRARSRGNNRCG